MGSIPTAPAKKKSSLASSFLFCVLDEEEIYLEEPSMGGKGKLDKPIYG